jgi:hypothetical protein
MIRYRRLSAVAKVLVRDTKRAINTGASEPDSSTDDSFIEEERQLASVRSQ